MSKLIVSLFLLLSNSVLISQAIEKPNSLNLPICFRNDLYISNVSNDSLLFSWRKPYDWGLDTCNFSTRIFFCDQHLDSLKFTYSLLDTTIKYELSSVYDTNIVSVIIPRLEYSYIYGSAYSCYNGCLVSDGYIPAGCAVWNSWPLKVSDYSNIGIVKSNNNKNRFVLNVNGSRINIVNISGSKLLSYVLYNSIGQTIPLNSVPDNFIDVSSLKNGLYILKLNCIDYSSIHKIILAR